MPAKKKPDPAKVAAMAHARRFSPVGSREFAVAGARTSNARQKERKTLAEIMRQLLDAPAPRSMVYDNGLEIFFPEGMDPKITNAMLLSASVMAHGVATGKGDVFSTIRDTIGEKPTDKQEITGADGAPLTPPAVTVNFSKGKPDAT